MEAEVDSETAESGEIQIDQPEEASAAQSLVPLGLELDDALTAPVTLTERHATDDDPRKLENTLPSNPSIVKSFRFTACRTRTYGRHRSRDST